MEKLHLAVIFMALLAALTGCSGEFYVGHRQLDEVQQTQIMRDKSWMERVGVRSPARYEVKQGS